MKLSVPDMSCAHCKAAVEAAVAGADPGARVTVDLATKEVAVQGTAPPDRVIAALAAAGFAATAR